MADLAIVIVSTNEAHWIEQCLPTVFDHAGDARLEVIVVDNSSTDGTRELVESSFPQARVVRSPNHGFGYGNNRGIEQANARYVLLLNPDTEVLDGTFGELVRLLDERPEVGLAGVRQFTTRRHAGADDPPLSQRDPHARRGAVLRALAGSSRVGGRTRARPGAARARAGVRLGLGLVHARAPRGAAERRAAGRALLHLLRGAGPVPADQAWGLADTSHAPAGDRPPCRQGGRASADDRSGRLHAQAVRVQVLQPLLSRPLPRGVQISLPDPRRGLACGRRRKRPSTAKARCWLCARWPAAPSRRSARRHPPGSTRSSNRVDGRDALLDTAAAKLR